ncbi:UDP-N-acetylmuramoyl-L-alanine--D-glutamate ligase [Candidatus Dependentiae bacterium]|nr:UDP-N-acetylmuramoyl-L-alanine--D-glutamate ligase [Candidatus Dependentiae bacterium]
MLTNNRIGIWGFGIVGKSALKYLLRHTAHIQVLTSTPLSAQDQQLLEQLGVPVLYQNTDMESFLRHNDYIVASPGIDLRPYAAYRHKWLTELDLLRHTFTGTLIGITGSVGKTTITSILTQITQHHATPRIYTGGNIGAGMLDMLTDNTPYDAALLELSSFQLEHTMSAAPDLAIWTTFCPNHLDRHGSLDAYFDAKFKLLAHQNSHQQALVPASIVPYIVQRSCNATCNVFVDTTDEHVLTHATNTAKRIFFLRGTMVVVREHGRETVVLDSAQLPPITFVQNWLIIISALHIMHTELSLPDYMATLVNTAHALVMPEHRLELVANLNGITIYNDSKATTPASTLAAVQALSDKPIILLLGGLSKGIDRQPLIMNLRQRVQKIICFGKESQQLKNWCDQAHIPAQDHATLDDAVPAALHDLHSPTHVLFSPAGSSFDLFKDYQERGTYFKNLIAKLTTHAQHLSRHPSQSLLP